MTAKDRHYRHAGEEPAYFLSHFYDDGNCDDGMTVTRALDRDCHALFNSLPAALPVLRVEVGI